MLFIDLSLLPGTLRSTKKDIPKIIFQNVSIKRLVLDVLKPHMPGIVELAEELSRLPEVSGVNVSLSEVDQETDTVKIVIEGTAIDFDNVRATLSGFDAVVHSVDNVVAGQRILEDVETPQD